MANTKIEWATKVWNPVTGCLKVSNETVLYENGKTISRTKFITDEDTNSFFAIAISRYGKKKAGRLLDGTEYNEFPDFSRIITHNPQSQAGGCPRPPVC
jgi:protein gp37